MDHVLHLIELYEDNSVLWNHTMEEHKDLSAFEQAKQKIVERLKKKGWHYIVKHVGKKINSLKSNFRRTHKKVKDSKASGISSDQVYKPRADFLGSTQNLLESTCISSQVYGQLCIGC